MSKGTLQELLDSVSLRIGELEIQAARAGLNRPKAEADAIWNQMLEATAVLRKQKQLIIEDMTTIIQFQ